MLRQWKLRHPLHEWHAPALASHPIDGPRIQDEVFYLEKLIIDNKIPLSVVNEYVINMANGRLRTGVSERVLTYWQNKLTQESIDDLQDEMPGIYGRLSELEDWVKEEIERKFENS